MKTYQFNYSIDGLPGSVRATSVPAAIELAKRDFLKKYQGMDFKHGRFLAEKGQLQVCGLKLVLSPLEQQRFVLLYRWAKEACLSGEEDAEFKQLYSIQKDPRLK